MKQRFVLAFAVMILAAFAVAAQKVKDIPNPAIDMKAFLKAAGKAAKHRETHRLTEEEFIQMSKEPGVVTLDARSRQKYDELHIRGAVNLSFPDITVESLATMFPDKPEDTHLLQQQLHERPESVPDKDPAGVVESLNICVALHVRLPKHIRARTAARRKNDEARVGPDG